MRPLPLSIRRLATRAATAIHLLAGLMAGVPQFAFAQATVQHSPAGYALQGTCAGYARLPLQTPKGWCAALVADARDGLRMPRRLLEMAPGQFWITDMGSWEARRGRLLALNTQGQPGDSGRLQVLAEKLDRPHGLAMGRDGRVYIGEAGRIWRTPVTSGVVPEAVIDGLPSDGAHPLKEFAFGDDDKLWINIGSATDACRSTTSLPDLPCPETAGEHPRAAVYLATLGGPENRLQSLRPYATGLRNSLGLAVTRDLSGQKQHLWQAENSVDYPDAQAPAEELNALKDGQNHGWPTCLSDHKGRQTVARGYEGRTRCKNTSTVAPFLTWPAHVAPLQLLSVPRAAHGAARTPWSGHLLAAWHGYRPQGHRIVGWAVGPDGLPQGRRLDFVAGWQAEKEVRPLGNPAGMTVDSQGRLWIVEDRNRTVILIAPDKLDTPAR